MADDDEKSEAKLLKISRGAHKLTQIIHSLPNSSDLDGHSKILLQESFNIQQTMIKLRKLQQASKIMYGVKERLKIDFAREKEVSSGKSLFSRLDDLKKVIRESSSYDQHFRTASIDEKLSSIHNPQPQRTKSPSLIAKLMGLKELPSESNHAQEKRKCLVQTKSMLDIGMPTVRRSTSKEKNPTLGTEALRDIVEVGKSNGIMVTDKTNYFDSSRMEPNDRDYHKDNEASTTVTIRTRKQPHFIQEKIQFSTEVAQKNTAGDSEQMLPRKFGRREAENAERNKAIAFSKNKDVAPRGLRQRREVVANPRGKHNVASKPVNKELRAIAATKSQAKLSSNSTLATTRSERSVSRSGDEPKRHPQASTLQTESRNSNKSTVAKPVKKPMDIRAINGDVKNKNVQRTKVASNSLIDALPSLTEMSCKQLRKGAMQVSDETTTIQRSCKRQELDIHQILNSQSFVRHMQELFQLDCRATNPERIDKFSRARIRNPEIIFDFSYEIIVRKRRQLELSNYPVHRSSCRSSAVVISLDQLVEEISQAIDKLNSYSKICDGTSLCDSIHVILERDLMCKEMQLNAMWDVGWVRRVCVEDTVVLVGQVEDHIFCCLVDEIVRDLFVY